MTSMWGYVFTQSEGVFHTYGGNTVVKTCFGSLEGSFPLHVVLVSVCSVFRPTWRLLGVFISGGRLTLASSCSRPVGLFLGYSSFSP